MEEFRFRRNAMASPAHNDLLHVRNLINNTDLSATVERLVKINKWSKKEAVEASHQYRNFLFLKKKYGHQYSLPPSIDIDEVWHAHILHTEDYYAFCEQVFGGFLHHHPHHGKNGEISDQTLFETFEKQTQRFYLQEFGEPIYAVRTHPLRNKISEIIGKIRGIFKMKNGRLYSA